MLNNIKTQTPQENGHLTYINESRLYIFILRSDMDKAKDFKRWIKKEVLPFTKSG